LYDSSILFQRDLKLRAKLGAVVGKQITSLSLGTRPKPSKSYSSTTTSYACVCLLITASFSGIRTLESRHLLSYQCCTVVWMANWLHRGTQIRSESGPGNVDVTNPSILGHKKNYIFYNNQAQKNNARELQTHSSRMTEFAQNYLWLEIKWFIDGLTDSEVRPFYWRCLSIP
jgi:hypothetical protein